MKQKARLIFFVKNDTIRKKLLYLHTILMAKGLLDYSKLL